MAEPTSAQAENVSELTDEDKKRQAARAKARKESLTAPEKEYDLPAGDYSGYIDAETDRIHVPDSGKYRTKSVAEQSFIESVLAREGKEVGSSKSSGKE